VELQVEFSCGGHQLNRSFAQCLGFLLGLNCPHHDSVCIVPDVKNSRLMPHDLGTSLARRRWSAETSQRLTSSLESCFLSVELHQVNDLVGTFSLKDVIPEWLFAIVAL